MEFRPKAKKRECFLECDINVDRKCYCNNLVQESKVVLKEGLLRTIKYIKY